MVSEKIKKEEIDFLFHRISYPNCCLNCVHRLRKTCTDLYEIERYLRRARKKSIDITSVGCLCSAWS